MSRVLILLSVLFIVYACANEEPSENTMVDLQLEIFDYFEEEIPFNNIVSQSWGTGFDQQAALGRLLFYDNRLSLNNSISCANCHEQAKSFSDGKAFSLGLENYETKRSSMPLVNVDYHVSNFWEGHNGDLKDHILDPISNHIEMGMKSSEELVTKLKTIDDYVRLFDEVFAAEINEELLRTSLSMFVKSMISYNSKFDKGMEINFTNFSIDELRGKDLFFGDAQCGECHKGDHFAASWRRQANIGLELDYEDEGAGDGKFKVPTLRNIAETAPYMHDGRFETLEEVIEHYNSGVQDHPELDWVLREDLGLTANDKENLVAFLQTLTDHQFMSDPKFSNPF